MHRLLCILVAGIVLLGTAAQAGSQDVWTRLAAPAFSHLTQAEGLPYPVAFSVVQDGEGFIWVATPGGVARWDGYRATVFRHDDKDPNSLPENVVTDLVIDEHGRLWLATASGIIARYVDAARGFMVYREHGSGFGRLLGMASDRKGGIWVASRRGLARLDVQTGVWRQQDQLEGIPPGEVGSVLVDSAGSVWAGAAKGLYRRKSGYRSFDFIALPAEADGDFITALFESAHGEIWFGTQKGGIGKVDSGTGLAQLEKALPPSGYRITSIIQMSPDTMWFGDFGGGIRAFHRQTREVQSIRHDPVIHTSLGDDTVTSMLVDRSGLVWVATLRGVHPHIPSNGKVFTAGPSADGLAGADIRSLAASADGKLWLGYRSGGVTMIDPATNQIKTLRPGKGAGQLPPDTVQAVDVTPDGAAWAALPSGLYRLDMESGTASLLPALANANIRGLWHDHTGLWATGSMGVAHLATPNAEPRIYRSLRDNPTSLTDASGQLLFRDRGGRLWIGTQRGLNLMEDPEQGRFRRFLSEPGNPASLPGDVVSGLAEDRQGRLWVGTGNGIGILAPFEKGQPARFIRLGAAQGLPNDTVLSLVSRDDGTIAVGTGGGMVIIDPETLTIRELGPAEGVRIGTFWAGSGGKLPDGTVVLGGFGGMVVVRPGPLPDWTFPAPVVTTRIRAGDETIARNGPITLGPDKNGFQVEFAALDFSASERNRYSYRLVGNDKHWISAAPHQRLATYTNLPPGTYRLELRGSNSAGLWNEQLRGVDVRVVPAWYQALWFKLAAALGLAIAAMAAIQGRKAYYLRRERDLARQVEAKTVEVRRAMDAAETANRAKSRFLAVMGHEIRTPLNGLLGILQLLEGSAFGKDARGLLNSAKVAGNTLRTLVESILDYGVEGDEGGGLLISDVNLESLLSETMELVRPQAALKNLTLSLRIEPEHPGNIRSDYARLFRILSNLLGNAVKFTERGSIEVGAVLTSAQDGMAKLTITVTDTGIGIAEHMIDSIFAEFTQVDDSNRRKYGGVGLGLAVSRRIAIRMGGTLSAESRIGQGSCFRLDIPVVVAPEIDKVESEGGKRGAALRVLVVDDDELNRRVAERLLAHLGHRVTVASGGKEALAAAAAAPFDVVLMDLWMPGMDGYETAQGIRALPTIHPGHLRILAMSADLSEETRQRCADTGMDGSLAKPVLLGALREALAASPPLALPLDQDFLEEQVDILGPEEMIRLSKMFRRASWTMLHAIDDALAKEDRTALAAIAHRLRSSSGPVGLVTVANYAARIQMDAPEAPLAVLREQVEALRQARLAGLKALSQMARTNYGRSTVSPKR